MCPGWGEYSPPSPRQTYPSTPNPHPSLRTDWLRCACENITFLQLRWRAACVTLNQSFRIVYKKRRTNTCTGMSVVQVTCAMTEGRMCGCGVRGVLTSYQIYSHIYIYFTFYLTLRLYNLFTRFGSQMKRCLVLNFYRPQTKFAKVIFSQVSVHGGVCPIACWDTQPPPGRHPFPFADTPLGRHTLSPGKTPPSRRLLQRTVRILLECILVFFWNCKHQSYQKNNLMRLNCGPSTANHHCFKRSLSSKTILDGMEYYCLHLSTAESIKTFGESDLRI